LYFIQICLFPKLPTNVWLWKLVWQVIPALQHQGIGWLMDDELDGFGRKHFGLIGVLLQDFLVKTEKTT